MKPTTSWSAAIWLAAVNACAPGAGGTPAGDEAVLDHVEALGFERMDAVVAEDTVVVEGDMVFDRAALLGGEYERLHQADGSGLIEKGYRYPSLIAEEHRRNIRLRFAGGRFAPTAEIRSAMTAAAKGWSTVPGSSIRITSGNTGPEIMVHTVPANEWLTSAPPGCEETSGCSYAPKSGKPGSKIYLRRDPLVSHAGCETWSPSILAHVARHELGHTLGFAHPKQDRALYVKGTKRCSAQTEEACTLYPNYDTVMGAPTVVAPCTWSPARVTKDDYATCAAVYPATR